MGTTTAGRFAILVVSVCVGRGASDSVDATVNPELAKMAADLEQLVISQRHKIQDLEVARERRLSDLWSMGVDAVGSPFQPAAGETPSIFATGDPVIDAKEAPGKVPYGMYGDLTVAMTHMWVILCGALVMFMQAGFAMLEAGSCRVKNVQNIMLKNLVDVTTGTIAWYLFGHSFAFSGPFNDDDHKKNGFIGGEWFIGHTFLDSNRDDGQIEPSAKMMQWFFQWAFCSAAATIVSGGIAERVNLPAYALFSFFMTAWIYPVIVAWTWGGGFLASMNDVGYMDFAGSGIVHMTGGMGALVGAIIAGPRSGRFEGQELRSRILEVPESFNPHSLPLVVLGTLILWFGWYGFNCGSTLSMTGGENGMLAGQIAVNTTLAGSTSGLVVFVLRWIMLKKYDIGGYCCGILAGLVSITAGCGSVETGSAMFIGLLGGLIYQGASTLLKVLKIDDPVDAFAVHGACGAWGVLAAALFDWGKAFEHYHGFSGFKCVTYAADEPNAGECRTGAGGAGVAANIVEIIVIALWVAFWCGLIFGICRKLGWLNATDDLQDLGHYEVKHSPKKGYSYDDFQSGTSV